MGSWRQWPAVHHAEAEGKGTAKCAGAGKEKVEGWRTSLLDWTDLLQRSIGAFSKLSLPYAQSSLWRM